MGNVPARERRVFHKEESEICSLLAEEMVSFAQLGVIMNGLFEDAILGVRCDFCGREGQGVWSCPEKASVAVYRAIEQGSPPCCPLDLAHVQTWLFLLEDGLYWQGSCQLK